MAVFRVEKTRDYTVMSNHHLKNRALTLKAKGLLSQMLSLPESWDYSLKGLSHINRESIDAIRTAVWELEKAGYIMRQQGRDERGKMTAIVYIIYEQPQLDRPALENPTSDAPIPENPALDNPMQLNTNRSKTYPNQIKTAANPNLSNPYPSVPQAENSNARMGMGKDRDGLAAASLREVIKKRIEYDVMAEDAHIPQRRLDEVVDLMCNQALEQNGHAERIDHRSYERQGIEQIPTIHLGSAASQMEQRGIRTERGNINHEIEVSNQKLRQLKARLVRLQSWLKEEAANTEPPTLADVITNILSRREQTGKQSHYTAIHNLKAAAHMLNFLTANDIRNMAGLDEKLQSMIEQQFSIREELRPIDRRLKTLDKHIEQAEYYLEFKPFIQTRRQMKPKQQADYTEAHRREFTLYEAAERYLKGVMNGKTGLPLKAWKVERDKLNADRRRLNGAYISLKNDTAEVEKILRNVYDIMRQEQHREQPTKKQNIEL